MEPRIRGCLGGLGLLIAAAFPASSATITVTSLADSASLDGGCTLREAVANANDNAVTHTDCAVAGEPAPTVDRIAFGSELSSGVPLTIQCVNEELYFTDPVEIDGPGADRLTVDRAFSGRHMQFTGGASGSTVRGLTLANGRVDPMAWGGAIYSGADLTLERVRLTGNQATTGGGIAIANADLTITDSEISDNRAVDPMSGSTSGGGIFLHGGHPALTLDLDNVTVSGNRTDGRGGGISVHTHGYVAVNLRHVTLAANQAGASLDPSAAGGGLYISPYPESEGTIAATLTDVIVSDNTAPFGPDIFENGDTTLTLADSVVWTTHGYTPESATNVVNADPLLGFLAFNGGPTRTHALPSISDAVDLGASTSCLTPADQRGFPRPIDGDEDLDPRCDAGAFEYRVQESGDFHTLPPCRVVDTRLPESPNGGPALAAGTPRNFTLAGVCGIPASAVAVAVNVTAVGGSAAGNLQLYEGSLADPPADGPAAIVYYPAGAARANNAVVSLCTVGTINAFAAQESGAVHLVLDVFGYFE